MPELAMQISFFLRTYILIRGTEALARVNQKTVRPSKKEPLIKENLDQEQKDGVCVAGSDCCSKQTVIDGRQSD